MTKDEMGRRILDITGPAQAEYIWSLWVEFVADWIEDHNSWGDEAADANARLWREEMWRSPAVTQLTPG